MLGIEDYGSDNGSDNDSDRDVPPKQPTTEMLSKSSMNKGGAQATKPKRPPKKIAIGLPSLSKNDEDDTLKDERPAKKPRLQSGAGVSSLLSMLPAPQQKNSLPSSSGRERVLGGGSGPGLVFSTPPQDVNRVFNARDTGTEDQVVPLPVSNASDATARHSNASHPFLPPSLARGKPSISVEEATGPSRTQTKNLPPAVDFFSLGLFLRPMSGLD